jgi:hypothetical protein
MNPNIIILIVLIILPFPLLVLWLRARRETLGLKDKFSSIIPVGEQLALLEKQAAREVSAAQEQVSRARDEELTILKGIDDQRAAYAEKRQILERLEQQVAIYDEKLAFAELGIYEPHFEFSDSEVYKAQILTVRQRQKVMLSAKIATTCPADWTVDGSRSKGQTMVDRQTRLTMRAFNNECQAAIANARWNNAAAMQKRIINAANQINGANASMRLEITKDYILLKIEELHLTHEYREKLKAEKDERVERARAEREEKKFLAEAEAAEREERRYQALLERARREIGVDQSRIAELERALGEAHATSERARAMAQLTKSGLYIISNIGSLGDDVVKIGLTRRLDPDDRVRELGDASVPFSFDTHAIIYSEQAPALEAALHREFHDRRINASNMRKEFFCVSPEEVEAAVKRLAPEANFFKDREAQEWHETLARRSQVLTDMQTASDTFPREI